MREMFQRLSCLPWWQRSLIGAAIGGPTMMLLAETARWWAGKGFFR